MIKIIATTLFLVMLTACGKKEEGTPQQPAGEMQKSEQPMGEAPKTEQPAGSMAQAATLNIMSPKEGEEVAANTPLTIQYEATPGANGDHVHIIVDGGSPEVVKQLSGSYTLPALAPGEHTITIMLVTSEHKPTGVEASIHVTAK